MFASGCFDTIICLLNLIRLYDYMIYEIIKIPMNMSVTYGDNKYTHWIKYPPKKSIVT